MNGRGTEPVARLTTSRWVTSAGHENARRAAVRRGWRLLGLTRSGCAYRPDLLAAGGKQASACLGSTASRVAAWPFRPGEGDLRQIAAVDEAAESQHAVSHLSGARENGGAAGEMCGVRDADSRRGSGLRRVRGACRRAAVTSGGRAFRFPRRGSVRASEVSTTRLRPGYDMAQVDGFLDAVRDTFLGVRQPPLTAEEIRAKQFATTRLRPGYDEEEVDAFLEDVEARLRVKCAECGAESARATEVCARCGAPVAGPESAADPAAGAVSNGAGQAASAATAWATGQARQQPYVPGCGGKVPPGLRRVLRGYSWMAWGAVSAGWALLMAGGYFYNLDNTSDLRYFYASIASVLLAAVLFGRHIRWCFFLKRPRDACSATVAASRRAGRALVLDAPDDGYPSKLKVRLAWWAEPQILPPGGERAILRAARRRGPVAGQQFRPGPGIRGHRQAPASSPGRPGRRPERPASAGRPAGRATLSAVGASGYFRCGPGRGCDDHAHRVGAVLDGSSGHGTVPARRLPDRRCPWPRQRQAVARHGRGGAVH